SLARLDVEDLDDVLRGTRDKGALRHPGEDHVCRTRARLNCGHDSSLGDIHNAERTGNVIDHPKLVCRPESDRNWIEPYRHITQRDGTSGGHVEQLEPRVG